MKLGEFLVRGVLASIQDYQHILDENVPRCLYMAPEQFHGKLDAKTDQYALGCLAYVLLTGRVPFAGSARATLLQKHERDEPQALTAINPAVPAHIEEAVLRSLAKIPDKRYSSVQAFLEALDIPGEKVLADQNTVKQAVPGALLEGVDGAGGAWEWADAVPPGDSDPTGAVGAHRLLLAPFLTAQPRPGRPARSEQKRGLYVIVPVVLLVLVLLFGTSRWLFFPGGSGSARPRGNTASITPTSGFLSPTTAADAQTTATVIAIQISTPTSAPRPSRTPNPTASATSASIRVPLASLFNNKGIGSVPGQADFDGSGYSYPANQLPPGGQITVRGVSYQFPGNAPRTNDNLIALGQTIPLTPGNYRQAFLLVAASWGPVSGAVTIRYTDGFTATANMTVPDWYSGPSNGLSTTYRYAANGIDQHAVYIYVVSITLNPARVATALLLPGSPFGLSQKSHIHVFSLTLLH